jgi:hypothetical protein
MDLTQWISAGVGLTGVAWTILDRLMVRARRETQLGSKIDALAAEVASIKQWRDDADAASDVSMSERAKFGERLRLVEVKAEENSRGRERFIAFESESRVHHQHCHEMLEKLGRQNENIQAQIQAIAREQWGKATRIETA